MYRLDLLLKEEEVPKRKDKCLWPGAGWSNDYRPLPLGGRSLPPDDFMHAALRTGFRG